MSLQNKLMSVGQPAAMAQQTAGDVAATAVATGTTQADALPLSCAYNYVTTVDSGTGVRLYGQSARPSSIGDEQTVYNAGANALNVYPPAGEQILGVIANAAFSIPTSSKLTFKKVTNTLWVASETFVQSGTGGLSRTVAQVLAAMVRSGDFDTTPHFNTARDALTETVGFNSISIKLGLGITTGQQSTNATQQVYTNNYIDSASGPFEIRANSSSNTGVGAGTSNNAWGLGFNVGRAFGGSVTANKSALIMAFENDFFDDGGDNKHGCEWYVEYFSPDGTSVQLYRPYYARIFNGDNAAHAATIYQDIGTDGSGTWQVRAGAAAPLLYASPTQVNTFVDFYTQIGTTPVFKATGLSANVNYIQIAGANTGGGPSILVIGETNAPMLFSSRGTGRLDFMSNATSQVNFRVVGGGTSGRFVQVTSSSGNPIIAASAGRLAVGSALTLTSLDAFVASDKYLVVDSSGNVHVSALGPAS